MHEEARRMFRRLLDAADCSFGDVCWQPSADVYREGPHWLVKFDLAGVRPDEVELNVCGRTLRIAGVRRDPLARPGKQAYRLEISYSRFERSIEFPCELDEADIEHQSQDGMLFVQIRMPGSQP